MDRLRQASSLAAETVSVCPDHTADAPTGTPSINTFPAAMSPTSRPGDAVVEHDAERLLWLHLTAQEEADVILLVLADIPIYSTDPDKRNHFSRRHLPNARNGHQQEQ